jgi:hypothetical protein
MRFEHLDKLHMANIMFLALRFDLSLNSMRKVLLGLSLS